MACRPITIRFVGDNDDVENENENETENENENESEGEIVELSLLDDRRSL